MKLHANAQTCPHCRSLMVSKVMDGQMAASVARDFQVSHQDGAQVGLRFFVPRVGLET